MWSSLMFILMAEYEANMYHFCIFWNNVIKQKLNTNLEAE